MCQNQKANHPYVLLCSVHKELQKIHLQVSKKIAPQIIFPFLTLEGNLAICFSLSPGKLHMPEIQQLKSCPQALNSLLGHELASQASWVLFRGLQNCSFWGVVPFVCFSFPKGTDLHQVYLFISCTLGSDGHSNLSTSCRCQHSVYQDEASLIHNLEFQKH